jgi:hypothetical protein
MTSDIFGAVEVNPIDHERVRAHLERIKEAQARDGDLLDALSVAIDEFNKFFLNYGKPSFAALELRKNDTPSSEKYNKNITTADDDIGNLYEAIGTAARGTVASYNYATVVTEEVKNNAAAVASKVLDLNILNDFTKGSTIVAGDDFIDESKVDYGVGVDTTQATILRGASAVSLKTVDTEIITTPETKVTITPVMPVGVNDETNTKPTPLNLERFYEGQFYAPVGEHRPEGGNLELKYIVDPSKIPSKSSRTVIRDGIEVERRNRGHGQLRKGSLGFYAIVPATEDSKQLVRSKMFDGDPSTFWECEFVYKTEDLLSILIERRETLDGSISEGLE